MVCNSPFAGLTATARVFDGRRVVLLLVLNFPSKLVTTAKLRILFLLEELLLSGILLMNGTLTTKFSL